MSEETQQSPSTPNDLESLRARMERFFDHLQRFATATAARARGMLLPVRIFAALSLLAAVWVAWRLGLWSSNGSISGFFLWLVPMALPSALLFVFYVVFRAIASLPDQLSELRELVAGLGPNVRDQLDKAMGRSEGHRFGLGRIVALGRVLLELRRLASTGAELPQAFALAPMMANPLFWLLFAITCLIAIAVIGVALLLVTVVAVG